MQRPGKFEHHRYVGDKRTQVVYDIDEIEPEDEHLVTELMAAETFICFGPDTLAEARNRGYRLFSKQRAAARRAAAAAAD
jgi:hypothetical protein